MNAIQPKLRRDAPQTRGRLLGAAERILGYSPDETPGQPGQLIFTREDQERGLDEYELAVARQSGHCDDNRWHVRQDGTHIWLSGGGTVQARSAGRGKGAEFTVRLPPAGHGAESGG